MPAKGAGGKKDSGKQSKGGKQPARTPGSGKAKKKKWSKGKVRDKLNNAVLFDSATYDKLIKEVPSYKMITPSIVSERLKIRGSLARIGIRELKKQGLIKEVVSHHKQMVFARSTHPSSLNDA